MFVRELMVVVKSEELVKALNIVSEGGQEIVKVLAVPTDKKEEMKCYVTRKIEWRDNCDDFLPLEHWEEVFSALEMMDWVYSFSIGSDAVA